MALFRKSEPIYRRGITGLTKPANIPTAAQQAQSGRNVQKWAIFIPLLAFIAVGAIAFVGLQKLSSPQQTITVYSSAPPSGLAAQVMNALRVPHEREQEIARQAILDDEDGPMVVKPLNEVLALTQPDRVYIEDVTASLEVQKIEHVAAHVQPAPETAQVTVSRRGHEVAAVIEQASAGVWKPETNQIRVGQPVEEAPCISHLRLLASESTIFFESGGANLTASDLRAIRVVGRMVENCPDAVVYITGHSDPSGSREANMLLSWQRADNAARALEEMGFDPSQFEPIGFGARIPYAQGDADAELSRRVEFNIQKLLWETR